nr:oxalate--CoA ligase-like [Ipomoea trifida]
MATIRVRATAAPLNAAYTEEEFVFYLSDLESKLLLTPKEGNEAAKIVNDPSDVALLLHTSGTTSWPKGASLTQFNLVSSVTNIKSVYKLTESDSTMIVLPLFHVHGLC